MKGYNILLVLFLVIGSELVSGSVDDFRSAKKLPRHRRRRVKTTTTSPATIGTTDWHQTTTDDFTVIQTTTATELTIPSEPSTTTTSKSSNEETEVTTPTKETITIADETTTATSEFSTITSEPPDEETEDVTSNETTTTADETTIAISESSTITSEPSNEETEEVTTNETTTTTDETTTEAISESTATESVPSNEETEEVTTNETLTTTDETTIETISESTTTIGEPSNEETEEVTTLAPPTTTTLCAVPASKCPAPKSQLSATDLKDLIIYVANEMHVYASINNSYYEDAVNMRDDHETSLNSFMQWLEDRPHHLKHTLENLKHTQSRIQLNMNNINSMLRRTPVIRDFYEAQRVITNLQTEVNKIKSSCKCQRQSWPHPLAGYVAAEEEQGIIEEIVQESAEDAETTTTEDYQCGALADIYMTIKTNMKDFVKDIQEELNNQIKNDNKVYTEEIENLKNSLKNAALTSFGRTMYDILNLIDSYHHLEHDLNIANVNKMISCITETNRYVLNQIWNLKQNINAKRYQCQNCVYYSKLARLQSDNDDIQEENNDLLNKLMESYKTEIKNKIMNEYNEVFKNLCNRINSRNENKIKEYVSYLKPIQDEVNAITKLETDKLKLLRNNEAFGKLLVIEKQRATLHNSVETVKKQLNSF